MGTYELTVKSHFDAAHALRRYPGECRDLHGHTWDVEATVSGSTLDDIGIVYDFKRLKDDFPSLTLVTVYNTLQKLESSGLCFKVNPLHSSARYDGNMVDHQHLVCTRCNKVVDIFDATVSVELPEWVTEKFKIVDKSITFFGCCVECQEEERRNKVN